MSYHDTAKRTIDRLMAESPVLSRAAVQTLARLNRREFDPQLVDALMQPWGKSRLDLYDAFLFGQLSTALNEGWILVSRWNVGRAPFTDNEAEQNAALLNSLAEWSPIRARVIPGMGANGDGVVSSREALTFGTLFVDGLQVERQIKVDTMTLEIGHTEATTTYWHLAQTRGLARWPYESRWLWLFELVNDTFWVGPTL